jgi:hypothetical protein
LDGAECGGANIDGYRATESKTEDSKIMGLGGGPCTLALTLLFLLLLLFLLFFSFLFLIGNAEGLVGKRRKEYNQPALGTVDSHLSTSHLSLSFKIETARKTHFQAEKSFFGIRFMEICVKLRSMFPPRDEIAAREGRTWTLALLLHCLKSIVAAYLV